MKVSTKVKAFCYIGMSFGSLFFSFVGLVQGASLKRSLVTFMCSAFLTSLMLWVGFRIRENGKL
jgi:hypothetical protein